MAGADWSISLGFVIFLVALIVSIIYYLRYKKIYLVSLILSIAVYTFSVFYTWDVFELNKNGVLLLLIVSKTRKTKNKFKRKIIKYYKNEFK